MEPIELMVLRNRRLPLDVLTALLSLQSREDNAYPDTGESGETYDVELGRDELSIEAS